MRLFYRSQIDGKRNIFRHHHATAFTFGILPVFLGTSNDYLAYYNRNAFFSVPTTAATYFFCSFPLIALCSCIFLALYNDFEEATKTHCGVRNILPSISVAIGDFYWGRLIWKTLIFAHFPPRVLVAFVYAQLFRMPLESISHSIFRYLTCFVYLLELFSLMMLSAVTSKDDHFRHVLAFSTFQMAAMTHGILHIILYRVTGINDFNIYTRKSYGVKKACYKTSLLFLAICALLYHRHNSSCEPYVFSAFAFFEYFIVVTNILFHATFRLPIIFIATVIFFQGASNENHSTIKRGLKRHIQQVDNAALPVQNLEDSVQTITFSTHAIPGYLPDFEGDQQTELQAIQETRALNAPFFLNLAAGIIPRGRYIDQQSVARPGYNAQSSYHIGS